MPSIAKERAERLFQWKQEGVKRAERLAREAMTGKPDRKKVAKA
jgi:hypothetical protein